METVGAAGEDAQVGIGGPGSGVGRAMVQGVADQRPVTFNGGGYLLELRDCRPFRLPQPLRQHPFVLRRLPRRTPAAAVLRAATPAARGRGRLAGRA